MGNVGPARAGVISECKNKAGRRTGPIAMPASRRWSSRVRIRLAVSLWKRSPLRGGYHRGHLPEWTLEADRLRSHCRGRALASVDLTPICAIAR
jgi:hypothetical protein